MAKIRVLSLALILLAFASIMCSSCSEADTSGSGQEDEVQNNTGTGQEDPSPNDGELNILTSVFPSPKEQNPFSVENMNETFKNFILENNPNVKESDIPELEANFLYVRFLPYGKTGAYELKTYDTTLALFKHPMDYNEIRKPVVYIDETLPDSIIPYFATVPVGYEFGSTPYEILQELFLTQPIEENEEDYQKDSRFVKAMKSNRANKVISDYLKSQGLTPSQLEATVLLNAGKFEILGDEVGQSRVSAKISDFINTDNIVAWNPFPSRWRPDGTLEFIDTTFKDSTFVKEPQVQPLVGVRVTAGYLFYWRESHTDKKGYFRSPERWTFSVNYEANFDSRQFLLQDGHSWYGEDLEIEKNHTKKAWNKKFEGTHAKWCVVWTAAYNYWYGEIYGLKRPREVWALNHSLEINVYNKESSYDSLWCVLKGIQCEKYVGHHSVGAFWESIKVYIDRNYLAFYGTTIHEIAHASHYENKASAFQYNKIFVNATFSSLPNILKETYARGIQRYLTVKRYGTWEGDYNNWKDGYTGLFEDLEDADDTYAREENGEKLYCDKVSGITVPMAEKSLFKSFSWNDLKHNLMSDYPNGFIKEDGGKVSYTRADMDALFDFWETGNDSPCPIEPSSSSAPLSSSMIPSSSSSIPPSSSSALSSSSSSIANDDGPGPDFTDTRDGYVYKTTKIGSQIWLAENLRYNAEGSLCYGDDPANCDIYGKLYDWATTMNLPESCNTNSCSNQINNPHQGICPAGWHIPTLVEWNKLILFVDGKEDSDVNDPYIQFYNMHDMNHSNGSGGIYRLLAASPQWKAYFTGGGREGDDFGFSLLPGGAFFDRYEGIQGICYFWGVTEGGSRNESTFPDDSYNNFAVYKLSYASNGGYGTKKINALSIRCVKD
jgi:uncharacterized protein (TIGR02145 family)